MEFIIQGTGISIILGVLLHSLWVLVSSWRRTQQESKQQHMAWEILDARLEWAAFPQIPETTTSLDWKGFRKFVVYRKVLEAKDIYSFHLTPQDKKPLPTFNPGQHLTFRINIPGIPNPVIRCYSLSDSPHHSDYYRITVKKMLSPPRDVDVPPGVASTWLHEKVEEGDVLDVKAPKGTFSLDLHETTPIVLVAGGIGITPFLSMVNALAQIGTEREVWVFYGVRNGLEHVQKEHLRSLSEKFANIHFQVSYQEAANGNGIGRDYQHVGILSVEYFKKVLPSNNFTFYLCGPPPMMEALIRDLKAWDVPEDDIKTESFGAPLPKKDCPLSTALLQSASSVEVTFAKSSKTFSWDPHAESLLDFAEERGIPIASGCRAGNCGTCLTVIKAGTVNCVIGKDGRPENGSCLMCISVPTGHLTLDL